MRERCESVGCGGVESKGVNRLRSQLLPQGSVNKLMLPDAVETVEGSRHNTHLKMITTTGEILNAHLRIWDSATNCGRDGVRLNHGTELELN